MRPRSATTATWDEFLVALVHDDPLGRRRQRRRLATARTCIDDGIGHRFAGIVHDLDLKRAGDAGARSDQRGQRQEVKDETKTTAAHRLLCVLPHP